MDRSTSSLSDPASQREGAIAAYGDGDIDVVEHIHAVILVLFVAERNFQDRNKKHPLTAAATRTMTMTTTIATTATAILLLLDCYC